MTADTSNTEPTMLPPDSGVKVRLYNPGFGDCLLLAFRGVDGLGRYMLIDCGVHHEWPSREQDEVRKARMKAIAGDIAEATGNHLHVVVATHQHTDHLSGFAHATEVFDAITMDEVWLAWTEDPEDEDALHLWETYGQQLAGLDAAVRRLDKVRPSLAGAIRGVMEFEFSAVADPWNNPQLKYLRGKSGKPLTTSQDYRHPDDPPLTVPGVPDAKVYVLGPPKEKERIRQLEGSSELYPKFAAMGESTAFAVVSLAAGAPLPPPEEQPEALRASLPFEWSQMIAKQQAENHELGGFFRTYYGFSDAEGHGSEWRRIDTDWLAAGGQLALNLNKKTNNTSLVLAIELTGRPSRPVLLFAADAQVGSWLSWCDRSSPGEGLPGETPLEGFLERTVLYKVGHHGSLNATLKAKGLERMNSLDLVAVLPVDENWAKTVPNPPWEHPAGKLLDDLKKRTRGRILRSDCIPPGDEPPERPEEASKEQWQAFVQRLKWDHSPDRLWIEYTVR